MDTGELHPCFLSAIIVIMQLSHSLQVGLLELHTVNMIGRYEFTVVNLRGLVE